MTDIPLEHLPAVADVVARLHQEIAALRERVAKQDSELSNWSGESSRRRNYRSNEEQATLAAWKEVRND